MLTWQFVDSIASSPTVRLDLNTLSGGILVTDQPELSPPAVRRVVSSSMLADGEKIPAAAFANRVLSIPLYLRQTTNDLQATLLQSLARELARQPGNIIRVTIATNPMFFRTFPAPDAVYQALMRSPAEGKVILQIPCEPFGYGLEENISPATITANPASGANPMFFDITSPKGDVETPLDITFSDGSAGLGTSGFGRVVSALAVRRRGTVSATPFFIQAESLALGTDTTLVANNASWSGAGSNSVVTTPGTTTMVTRLSTTTRHPSTASVDARGTYRVFVRVRQSVGTAVWQVRLNWGGGTTQITGPTATLPTDVGAGAPTIKYIDLGLVQIPQGFDPVYDALSGVELATEGTFFNYQATRVSGTGTLSTDVFLFLPADDHMLFVKWPSVQAFSTDKYVLTGGPKPSAYCLSTANQIKSVEAIEITGSGLMITPGRTNRIFYVRDIGTSTSTTGTGDVIGTTEVLTASYFPRYLFPLKPVST